MTRADHRSGTDRLAEVAARARPATSIVNVQGDEPLIDPAMIAAALAPFADPAVEMTTLCRRLDRRRGVPEPERRQGRRRPATASRCISRGRRCPYRPHGHGRAAVTPPFRRARSSTSDSTRTAAPTVLRLAALPPTALEETEMLEQLRALEHGIRIKVVETELDSIGVDTDADVARVRALLAASPSVSHARPVHDHAQP